MSRAGARRAHRAGGAHGRAHAPSVPSGRDERFTPDAEGEDLAHDPQVREVWSAAIRGVAGVAAQVFARHWQEHPALTPEAPDLVAEVLTWMIERSCHQIARDPATADAVARALSEVIWRTLHPARDSR